MRVAIVGVGNLGFVVAQRLLRAGCESQLLALITRDSPASRERCKALGMNPSDIQQVSQADVVVLTVKPQDAIETLKGLRPVLPSSCVIVSLMAGISCATLREYSGHETVVRAMPNLGSMVGESATVYHLSSAMSDSQGAHVEFVISSLGKAWRVTSEEIIDLATAVAGSGPAYLCWLGEHLEKVAGKHGFSEHEAHQIVLQTFKGAVTYLENSGETFAQLRSRVTSPQGTTAAAIAVLEEHKAGFAVQEAVHAALSRAQQLGVPTRSSR